MGEHYKFNLSLILSALDGVFPCSFTVSWGPACVDAVVQSAHCCCVGGLRRKRGFSHAPHHYKLAL